MSQHCKICNCFVGGIGLNSQVNVQRVEHRFTTFGFAMDHRFGLQIGKPVIESKFPPGREGTTASSLLTPTSVDEFSGLSKGWKASRRGGLVVENTRECPSFCSPPRN
mmetsp:Transcript_32600/g.127881  ORF Transcript_32600/g.127881 Transcript_32600/m.127881 type:complete len:108 (+) Transcript_32600:138-461(+)